MTLHEAYSAMEKYAKRRGYTEKVVGDYAYRKPRKRTVCRLLSAKNGIVIVYDQDRGGKFRIE